MELVEGEDLSQRLTRGAIPPDEALAIAKQIAEALEEAHEHGIIHRDLKPANIKVTPDGKVKVLDFGLAKAFDSDATTTSGSSQLSHSPTLSRHMTEAGMIMGTAAYMSPEQARGKTVDKRTDIWAFGVVLFEMLAGQRLFRGETVSDTLAAVLREEVPWGNLPEGTPRGVTRLLKQCLARDPKQRLRDIGDARIACEAVLRGQGEEIAASTPLAGAAGGRGSWRNRSLAMLALLATGLAIGFFAGRSGRGAPGPITFERLTFRPGHFTNARFAPDGQTVFYAAAWDGHPREVYQSRPQAGELSLGFAGANLLSVSPAGELALLLPRLGSTNPYRERGTLAFVSASGGTPRELVDGVAYADWSPDGSGKGALVRESGGLLSLEYPLGTRLYETARMTWLRVSPGGDRIAVFEQVGDDWAVVGFDASGKRSVLSAGWADWWNLAWAPNGREVWFGAAKAGAAAGLYAVDLEGNVRELMNAPGTLEIHDIAPDGRALVARVSNRNHVFGHGASGPERKLSWLEFTDVADISRDGRLVLLREASERQAGQTPRYFFATCRARPRCASGMRVPSSSPATANGRSRFRALR